MDWSVCMWDRKERHGGKTVLASILLLCKSSCGVTLGECTLWGFYFGLVWFLLFPFSQHSSVPPHLLSLPCIAGSPAELLMGRVLSGHGVQYLKYPQIPWHSRKPQNSQGQHIYLEAAGVLYRDPLHQWLPPRPAELYWVCAGTMHTWLWPRVCVITAEFSSCLSFRSLWVFFCLPPSWCWSLKARQKCLMYLSLKTSTSSHGIMGIRAQPALKMPCLWLVSDDQSFVCWSLSVYCSMILRSEEKVISWKCWGWTLKK